jgi:hypothetical protein
MVVLSKPFAGGYCPAPSRRRSKRAVCRRRAVVGKATEERDTEDYKAFPHGMPTTEAATINADLLEFILALG